MKKIAVLKSNEEKTKNEKWGKINHDITIVKTSTVEEVQDNGDILIKQDKNIVNLTRKINETAKLLKNQTAKEKLEQIKNQLANI